MNKNELEIKEVNKEIAPEEVIYLINDFPLFLSNDFLSNNQLNSENKEKKMFQENVPIYLKNTITEKPVYLFYNNCSYLLRVGCSIQSFLVKKNAKNDIIIIQKEEFRVSKFEINYVKRNRFYYYLTQSGYLITTPLDIATFPLQALIYTFEGILEIGECFSNAKKKCFRGMIPG